MKHNHYHEPVSAKNKKLSSVFYFSKSALTFFYSNVRSLLSKVSHLNNYVSLYKPSIFAIIESWLIRDIPSSFFCTTGYNVFREDRLYSNGGGSLPLVSDDLYSYPIALPNCDTCSIDALACRLSLKDGQDLGCLCIYCPPNTSCSDNYALLDIVTAFLNFNFRFFDFNFLDISWLSSSSSSHGSVFLNFTQDNFFRQHVKKPSRSSSNSVLDLIFTIVHTQILELSVNEEFDNSDYSIIQFSVPLRKKVGHNSVRIKNFNNVNWYQFQLLSSQSLTTCN